MNLEFQVTMIHEIDWDGACSTVFSTVPFRHLALALIRRLLFMSRIGHELYILESGVST